MIIELAQDFHDAVVTMPREHPKHRMLELLEEAIRRDIHFIARHPTTLFQCMWNTCWWYDCPQLAQHLEEPGAVQSECSRLPELLSGKMHPLLEEWKAAKEHRLGQSLWLRAERPPAVSLGSGLRAVLRVAGELPEPTAATVTTYSPKGVLLDREAIKWSRMDESLAFTVDGRVLLFGCEKSIHVWSMPSQVLLYTLVGHNGPVTAIETSPDGRYAFSGSLDQTIHIWDLLAGKEVGVLRGHMGGITGVGYDARNRHIISGSEDGTLRIWDFPRSREVACLRGHDKGVTCLVFDTRHGRIITGSDDDTVRIWDCPSGRELHCIRSHGDGVKTVAISYDRCVILCGTRNGRIHLYDLASGADSGRLEGHGKSITCLAVSSDGDTCASGSDDSTIRIWSIGGRKQLSRLDAPAQFAGSVKFVPNGKQLATSWFDHTVRLWDSHSGIVGGSVLRGHRRPVGGIKSNPNTKIMYSWSSDNMVIIWDDRTGGIIRGIALAGSDVTCASISPDGTKLAVGTHDGFFAVLNADDGSILRVVEEHGMVAGLPSGSFPVWAIAFSPDGRTVATGSGQIRLWDTATGHLLRTFEYSGRPPFKGHFCPLRALAFRPDGEHVASGSADETVRVWNVSDGRDLGVITGLSDIVLDVAYSPDGKHVAARTWERTQVVSEDGSSRQEIRGCGDVCSIAMGTGVRPLVAVTIESETRIQDMCSARDLAWFPEPMDWLTTGGIGHTWYGAIGNHVQCVSLQGLAIDPEAGCRANETSGPYDAAGTTVTNVGQGELARVLCAKAKDALAIGNSDFALHLLREAERIHRATEDHNGLAEVLTRRANVLYAQGEQNSAASCVQEAARLFRNMGDKPRLAQCLIEQARMLDAQKHDVAVLALLGEAEGILRDVGDRRGLESVLKMKLSALRKLM